MRTSSHTHLDDSQGRLDSTIQYLDKEQFPGCVTLKIFEKKDQASNLALFLPENSLEGLINSINNAYKTFLGESSND